MYCYLLPLFPVSTMLGMCVYGLSAIISCHPRRTYIKAHILFRLTTHTLAFLLTANENSHQDVDNRSTAFSAFDSLVGTTTTIDFRIDFIHENASASCCSALDDMGTGAIHQRLADYYWYLTSTTTTPTRRFYCHNTATAGFQIFSASLFTTSVF